MTDLAEGRWSSVQTATQTFTCYAPGCEAEVKTDRGNGAYCREHREARKRARANRSAPSLEEAPAGEVINRGSEYRISAKTNGSSSGDDAGADRVITRVIAEPSPTTGPMERAALQLATAGRELDAVLGEYASLKPKIAAALQAWREALEQLPDTTNGHAPDVDSTAL